MMPARQLNAGSRANSVFECAYVCAPVCVFVCTQGCGYTLANRSHEVRSYEPMKAKFDEVYKG